MIIFAAFTGLRIREQSELQWRQVNLTKKELTLYVDGTKTKTARTVPLCAIAVRILQRMSAQPHSPLDLVFKNRFGGKVNTNGGWWFRCKKAAGLPHIRWHDLRHHFASWWMQNGGNEFHLQRVLGHTTTSMTKRYAHLRTEDLHHDLAKVDRTGRTAYEGVSDGVDTAQDPC
jgi:integrase